MQGPSVVARANSTVLEDGRSYHSRGNRHSLTACWSVLFDLMLACPLLREHVAQGRVHAGINYRLYDQLSRKYKDFDLVLAVPLYDYRPPNREYFADLAETYRLDLGPEEQCALDGLPPLPMLQRPPNTKRYQHPERDLYPLVIIEAKAAMTALSAAQPRLHDGLVSATCSVRSTYPRALSGGYLLLNTSKEFISPIKNPTLDTETPSTGTAKQMKELIRAISGLTTEDQDWHYGLDALGISCVDFRNDGSPMVLSSDRAVPQHTRYADFVKKLSSGYAEQFASLAEDVAAPRLPTPNAPRRPRPARHDVRSVRAPSSSTLQLALGL